MRNERLPAVGRGLTAGSRPPPAQSHLPPVGLLPEAHYLCEGRRKRFAWQAIGTSRGVTPQIPLPPRGRGLEGYSIRRWRGLQTESAKRAPGRRKATYLPWARLSRAFTCGWPGTGSLQAGTAVLPRRNAAGVATSAPAGAFHADLTRAPRRVQRETGEAPLRARPWWTARRSFAGPARRPGAGRGRWP